MKYDFSILTFLKLGIRQVCSRCYRDPEDGKSKRHESAGRVEGELGSYTIRKDQMLVSMHNVEASHRDLNKHEHREQVHACDHITNELRLWMLVRFLSLDLSFIGDQTGLFSFDLLPLGL